MSTLTEANVHRIYQWYADIERRLMDGIRILPFVERAEINERRSPTFASILLEAASLVDTLLRDQLDDEFLRDGKKTEKRYANINDYRATLNPHLNLSGSQSLLMVGIPSLWKPFEPWGNQTDHTPPWWDA